MANIDDARAAKRTLAQQLAHDRRVNGVGIGGTRAGYVVKVQLVSETDSPDLPSEINGVPVETVVVGHITTQVNALTVPAGKQ